jgi:hypothetical protein
MDLARIEADLAAWGLIERTGDQVQLTRRFRGAVTRAASELQALESEGRAPAGNALETALETALRDFALPQAPTPEHLRFLFAVEWTSLPAGVRDLLARR